VYAFTVQLSDAAGQTATRTLSIEVMEPLEYTIWPPTRVPGTIDGGPDASVEIGVKFRADVAGWVRGIRFYKAATNTGTHVGSLWTSGGTRLANATFQNESASGWQEVRFATPVAIAANTTYVASYHANTGHYAADESFFSGGAADNPPLHALASGGASGANGVYRYGSTPAFPNQSYRATNYWVDVVFAPSAPPPTLASIAVTPASPTLTVGATQQFSATGTYSDGSTANVNSKVTWGATAPGVVAIDAGGLAAAFNVGTTSVTASFAGVTGSTPVTVQAGTPPASEGPGGPILVVTHGANPFGRYLAEILRGEGLNGFHAMDVSLVTSATLAAYDVVLLAEFPLTAAHVSMLSSWVQGGGSLVAMRPDPQLAPLLGIVPQGTTLSEGYVRPAASGPGAGIAQTTLQYHGAADLWALDGAAGTVALADLYTTRTASAGRPAVTLRTAGLGRAAAFAYDLARSVVLTRQGNPAWSGQDRDGRPPVRSDDLFFGDASFDPKPDWVDFARFEIPQADEQQRLLANLVLELTAAKKPLPRFWYFPAGHKAVVVMTGDDHASGGTHGRFQAHAAASPPGCSVADWACVRSTSYVYAVSPLTATQAASWESQGFEVALHVTTGCQDWDSYEALEAEYASQLATFRSRYPAVPAPTTNRTHCIVWSDYDSQPRAARAHGIRLDTNYYTWPEEWVLDRPGFMTGSGIPMRFADRTGRIIDVFQAHTHMTDESGQTYPFTVERLIDAALDFRGYYGAFTANMHTDLVQFPDSEALVAAALARGVPVVSARQLLTWVDGRDRSSFGALAWNGQDLDFTVAAASGARNLETMLPASFGGRQLVLLTRDGLTVPTRVEVVKGVAYAFFRSPSGSYRASYR
jgi:hypothetical protein